MRSRRDALISVGAFLLPLALFLASAYYDVTYWDVGEMDTVPWIFGIAHPPGFPAYVVLGWLFSHLVAIGSVAFRMSLLSALATAAAAWCVARLVADQTRDALAGAFSAVVFSCGLLVWTHATRAEVHAVETACLAAALLYFLRWHRAARTRDLWIAAACYGVAIAVHPVALLAFPGILIVLIARLHRAEPRDVLIAFGVAIALAAVWFAYLPLRSAYVSQHALDPAAALGMPGGAFWNYDLPQTPDGFLALIGARDIDVHGAMTGIFGGGAILRAFAVTVTTLAREFAYGGLAIAALGAVLLARRDRIQAAALCIIAAAGCAFAASFSDESDRGRYFLQACTIGAYCFGIGMAWIRARGRGGRIAAGAVTAILTIMLLVQGRALFGQPHDSRARTEIERIFAQTPDNAVLVSTWVLAPPLAYAAYVERSAGRRTVIPAWYGDTEDVLPRWTRSRPVFVVGTPEGSVDGFRLERLASQTELYRVVHE